MDVYLAILEDRHTDVSIAVFKTFNGSWCQVEKWRKDYVDSYTWEAEEIPGWLLYIRTDVVDGPNMRIEKRSVHDE